MVSIGRIEIVELLFSKGANRRSPLRATVLLLISFCKPRLLPIAIKIITIPIAIAITAIFIIRAETVLSLDEDRIRCAKKYSNLNR